MINFKEAKDFKKIEIKNSKGFSIKLLENGSIYSIQDGEILINQILGSPIEGGMSNIYVRIHEKNNILYYPIIGPDSSSDCYYTAESICWVGKINGLEYKCYLTLDKNINNWFWTIKIKNNSSNEINVDTVYAQDLGIANVNGIRINEAYNSHYIDYTIFNKGNNGYIICCRQNQPQGKLNPWVMFGSLNSKAAGFLTDGFQFYGLSYKDTNKPEALLQKKFPNEKLQYEFAFPTIASKIESIKSEKQIEFTFYGYYESDHKEATSIKDLANLDIIKKANKSLNVNLDLSNYKKFNGIKNIFNRINYFQSLDLTDNEIKKYFPGQLRHKEYNNNKLFSFFYSDSFYVALKNKELETRRPHGHILRSGSDVFPSEEILSTTMYMYGLFNSQLTFGNTSFNKLLSVSRNHLNVFKSSGQRIFVKTQTGYELLGIPSAFESGLNHAKWIYKGKDSTIIIAVWTSLIDSASFVEISVEGKGKKEFLISNNIILGNNEYDYKSKINIDKKNKLIELMPSKDTMLLKEYPQSKFYITSKDFNMIDSISGDAVLYEDNKEQGNPYLVIKTKTVNKFTFCFTGNILNTKSAKQAANKYNKSIYNLSVMLVDSKKYWQYLSKGLVINGKNSKEEIEKFNDTLKWYMHNAMVHYTIPHGLEQYTGAAWGVRDVCQGPVEFLMSTRNYKYVKDIIKTVFTHQYNDTGNWPQWFMFDRYYKIQQHESHGDVIVWPLKAVCDYIEGSNDFTILKEKIAYTIDKSFNFTKEKYPLSEHIQKLITRIEEECIKGTSLICYGDGDWDDTLQPADASMRKKMVSGWTVELVYQTLKRYERICEKIKQADFSKKLKVFTDKMKDDFYKYIIKDGVASGFVCFNDLNNIDYMLHPSDKKTGLKYRLLPMTRGMISEIFDNDTALRHYKIIKDNLYYPDGVRLVDKPVKYNGGLQKFFKRAETSSYFGREVSLQYTHAHIRFIEAMAKLGKAGEVYKGLLMINPITIDKIVPNADIRQSNCYFSSSDADFKDRYQAFKEFGRIKKGNIKVCQGWRIYSSGPGIYLNQLISNFLGFRELFDDTVFDPAIPKELDGLSINLNYQGKKVKFTYNIKNKTGSPEYLLVNGKKINGERYENNLYRRGGLLINRASLVKMLNKKENIVEIYL